MIFVEMTKLSPQCSVQVTSLPRPDLTSSASWVAFGVFGGLCHHLGRLDLETCRRLWTALFSLVVLVQLREILILSERTVQPERPGSSTSTTV